MAAVHGLPPWKLNTQHGHEACCASGPSSLSSLRGYACYRNGHGIRRAGGGGGNRYLKCISTRNIVSLRMCSLKPSECLSL